MILILILQFNFVSTLLRKLFSNTAHKNKVLENDETSVDIEQTNEVLNEEDDFEINVVDLDKTNELEVDNEDDYLEEGPIKTIKLITSLSSMSSMSSIPLIPLIPSISSISSIVLIASIP